MLCRAGVRYGSRDCSGGIPVPQLEKMGTALTGLKRAVLSKSGVAATIQTSMVQAVILFINFGTGVITARTLGPGGRGEQAVLQMWPQIFALAFTLGLPLSMIYNLKRYPERDSQFFSTALLVGTVMGFLATLTGVLFLPYWLTQYSPEVVRSAQWIMLLAPLALLFTILNDVARAREEFTVYNMGQFLRPALTLLALIALVLTHYLTPLSAALSYVLTFMPLTLWMLIRYCRVYHLTLRGFGAAFRTLISYGVRSYGVYLFGYLVAGQLDRVLVVGLLDSVEMGLYVAAIALARTLLIFPNAVSRVVLPKAASRPLEETVALIGRGTRVSTSLALLVASILAILGPLMLTLVYGQGFQGAVPVFRLLLADTVLYGATLILSQAFMAHNKPGVVSLMQGLSVGLVIPLLLILVPRYGLVGAGLAVLISTTVRFIFAIVTFPIIFRVRPPRLRPTWNDFTTIFHERKGGRGAGN